MSEGKLGAGWQSGEVLSVRSVVPSTSNHNQHNTIVISARLVLPNTRKRKPQANVGAFFAQADGITVA